MGGLTGLLGMGRLVGWEFVLWTTCELPLTLNSVADRCVHWIGSEMKWDENKRKNPHQVFILGRASVVLFCFCCREGLIERVIPPILALSVVVWQQDRIGPVEVAALAVAQKRAFQASSGTVGETFVEARNPAVLGPLFGAGLERPPMVRFHHSPFIAN